MFERDLPGQNKAGYSADAEISALPLESCETMNNTWGYNINDRNFKSTKQLIHTLVGAAGNNANLLLNVGPRPGGDFPEGSVRHLKESANGCALTVKPSKAPVPGLSLNKTGVSQPKKGINSTSTF